MATRSGNIDITAALVLKNYLKLSDDELQVYLNNKAGLLGLSGLSDNIPTLLKAELADNKQAKLALETYVHNIQKAIGQMAAALNGVDLLAFTGTIGERSAPMRERVVKHLAFMDFILDTKVNSNCDSPIKPTNIAKLAMSKPIFVIPTDESAEMARRVRAIV